MSLATHRTALVALIAAVPYIGRVHGYQRYAREEGAFRALYLYSGAGPEHLRGWQVSNVAVGERTVGLGRVLCDYRWAIRGYMALQDASQSELVFDDLVEAIRAAYRANPTLGGVATAEATGGEGDGVQKLDAGPVLFCGVLCHSALLELETWDYLP